MEREEAINLIGWLKSKTNRDDDLEAIDMAIEALQAESTHGHGRLIDVDAVMRNNLFTERDRGFLNDAPTVPVVDITQRDLCKDISCEDCPFMQETCKLMDYVAYADRPHGEWIDKGGELVCSECGNSVSFSRTPKGWVLGKFCQSCGADMRKETE